MIREANEKDLPFIYATWLHSFKHGSYFAKKITNSTFFVNHHDILDLILLDDKVTKLIAYPKNEPDVILGYFVFDKSKDCAHFIYLKSNFRNFKIANKLLDESKLNTECLSFTHWTFDTDWITQKFTKLTYNPYIGGIYGTTKGRSSRENKS